MVKNLPSNAGDKVLIPGSGRSPGGGNGKSLQYSCLENSMDRGDLQATVHGVTNIVETTEQIHTLYQINYIPVTLMSVLLQPYY